jgi:hypothetical protein
MPWKEHGYWIAGRHLIKCNLRLVSGELAYYWLAIPCQAII